MGVQAALIVGGRILYYDLGNESVTVNPAIPLPPFQVRYEWETRASVARVGVNYKF